VRLGRLAHAYLFSGPAGLGKRLFAEELGKALLCEAPARVRLEACDRCPACVQVAAGTHPDYFLVSRPEDKLEVPIDTIRELCRNFALKAARGRGKVAIVDDADDLNEEAANCFLKTLEEPPPRSLLLLIGTEADRQLPTIISRCQIVRFAPLSATQVKEILQTRGIEDAALVDRLARIAGGSPGQALSLADPGLWEFRRTLLNNLIRSNYDSVAVAQAWIHFVEEAGKESAAQRRRAANVLRLLIEFLQTALALSVGEKRDLVDPSELHAAQEFVKHIDTEQLLSVLDRCLEADTQIDRRVQLVLVLEAIVDALSRQRKRSA
jgi:DNA polymerase-3 subunit delta'